MTINKIVDVTQEIIIIFQQLTGAPSIAAFVQSRLHYYQNAESAQSKTGGNKVFPASHSIEKLRTGALYRLLSKS